ncbi:MAG TPA: TrbI/VirB10 family protein [Vicinamibacterales bacterium]|nr:TrbI/VirB10 family protein [Vicinamibacterales bacterium]
MLSNRLAFAALAVACIAAAAGGGYLGTRQNAVPAPASAQTAAVTQPAQAPAAAAAPSAAAAPAPAAVPETEAVVTEPKPAAPARRVDKAREASAPKSARAAATQPPPLASTWPSAAAQPPAPLPAPAPPADAAPKPDEHAAPPPPPAPEPPQKELEELVVSRDSVIGLQTETRVSSETAKVEDRVEARVTRDVRVADRVAIPAGSRAIGAVTLVERGGKFKERARIGIRFHTLVLADGTRMPINTETIFREGESPANSSSAKIGGGAVGGAILGAILGGAKGAAIGAAAGGGAGTAATAAGEASKVVLAPGTPLTVRLQSPVTITVERE